jgi:hypothetical protein
MDGQFPYDEPAENDPPPEPAPAQWGLMPGVRGSQPFTPPPGSRPSIPPLGARGSQPFISGSPGLRGSQPFIPGGPDYEPGSQPFNPGGPGYEPGSQPYVEEDLCPGCGRDLNARGRRSWCIDCGFCSNPEQQKQPAAPPPPPPPPPPPLFSGWVAALVAGVALIVVANVVRGRVLSADSSLLAWWILVEGGFGLFAYLVGHALVIAVTFREWKENELFKYIDPVTVGKYAFEHLPKTRWGICAAGWGVTAFFCAVVVLWQNDFAFRDKNQKKAAAAAAEASKAKAKEDADPNEYPSADEVQPSPKEDLDARSASSGIDQGDADKAERQKSVTECVVIGYVADPKDPSRIDQLVLGTRGSDGSIRYAGTVSDFAKMPDVDKWLSQVKSQKPLLDAPSYLPGDLKAIPVEPSLSCKVGYAERTGQGVLKETVIKGVGNGGAGDAPNP